MKKQFAVLCLTLALGQTNSFGDLPSTIKCKPTIESRDNFEPEQFPQSNNLLRKPGELPSTCGSRVVIRGKIVDKNCVPLIDAKVFIWQVDCDGKYHYKPLRNIAQKSELYSHNHLSSFTGAGSTTTDNRGEFYFITIQPANISKTKSGYINVRIEHPMFNNFETKLYFSNAQNNATPEEFITFNYDPTGGSEVKEFMIVLPGENTNRKF